MLPSAVTDALNRLSLARADYDAKFAAQSQSVVNLQAANEAKANADRELAASADADRAAVESVIEVIRQFLPGSQPPVDPVTSDSTVPVGDSTVSN